MNLKYSFFLKALKKLIYSYLIMLGMFMLFRLIILFKFGDFNELKPYSLDVLNALYVGFKFDTSVIAYGILPVFLGSIFYSFFSKDNNENRHVIYSKTVRFYLLLVSIVFFLIATIDYFFYSYFQTHISPVIFGLKNDKTEAILVSLWADYPVVKVLIAVIIVSYLFYSCYKRIYKDLSRKKKSVYKFNPFVLILVLGIYFIGMRGSLGMFPLRLDHTSISTNTFVNKLVLNGPFALRIANGLQKETLSIHLDKKKTLKSNGFNSEEELLEAYLGNEVKEPFDFQQELLRTTKKNNLVEENPPNVVFVLVESLSNHYLDMHSDGLNLLGELDDELANCYVFRNFLSAKNLTVETLESIMLGTPKAPISQSSYSNRTLNSSVANPFKKAGYKTNYLTGDQLGWRNTGRFIKNQNFDQVQGFSFLEKKYINPAFFAWGIHDEYLYKHMYDMLEKATKPQFIFTLTISNHTPYDLPSHVVIPPQKISDSLAKQLIPSTDICLKNFASYYYAANELGKFIKRVRKSPLGKNTIIIATGDHNERGMVKYKEEELFLKRSVPLIVYLPEKYKPEKVNVNRFGSHKDIFPTIFNIALSNITYVNSGKDLFSDDENGFFAGNNYTTIGNKYGVIINKTNFYKWKTNKRKKLMITTPSETPELLLLKRSADAHKAAMMLNFQNDILSQSKNK